MRMKNCGINCKRYFTILVMEIIDIINTLPNYLYQIFRHVKRKEQGNCVHMCIHVSFYQGLFLCPLFISIWANVRTLFYHFLMDIKKSIEFHLQKNIHLWHRKTWKKCYKDFHLKHVPTGHNAWNFLKYHL